MEIDRTKIRALLLTGSNESLFTRVFGGGGQDDGTSHGPFRTALAEDPDVECAVFIALGNGADVRRIVDGAAAVNATSFPQTPAELMAYDVIVLSNVPRSALTDEQLGWLEEWIGRRGGGLLMAGGPNSFASGGWAESPIAKMLPVELRGPGNDWEAAATTLEPVGDVVHPIWRLVDEENRNKAAIRAVPEFVARNKWSGVKSQSAVVLGAAKPAASAGATPLFAVGQFGRGRTAALAEPLDAALAPAFARTWGESDNRYYSRFCRNLLYWLTEESSIGRRRLVVAADKRFYRPGDTVSLEAVAYDEGANRTAGYRIAAMLEPQSLQGQEPPKSPVKWPTDRRRTSSESGPFVVWGEEIDLAADAKERSYSLKLPLADALAVGASQSFRLELTAYEGQTQVDSTSVDVQVLNDPFEMQNPLPNHAFLERLAARTGGRVLTNGAALASMLNELPVEVGSPTVRKAPLWSQAWVLGILLALLTVEWFWRRIVGLA
jgi:uncharacterized membrane protein